MRIDFNERPTTTTLARAKVNLALAVGPPRAADGMHPIASWMARLDLADELTITRLDDGDLSRYAILWHDEAVKRSDIDWSITKDLTVRAHMLLQEEVGHDLPVQLKLEKRIPVGGGLGGGSADAAAMLRAIDDLFSLDLEDKDLIRIGARLGSDVPYCLMDRPAFVEGLGETMEAAPTVEGDVLLVVPSFGCATGAVYGAYDDSPNELRRDDVRAMAHEGVVDGGRLFNDLEGPAASAQARLRALLSDLRSMAGDVSRVHLTGSGSTCFILGEGGSLETMATQIRDHFEGVETVLTSLA